LSFRQDLHDLLCYDKTEDNDACGDKDLEKAQAGWPDAAGIEELDNDEEADEPEDKEDFKVDGPGKEHEDGYEKEPAGEGKEGELFLFHGCAVSPWV
jgi:hypothetical protein